MSETQTPTKNAPKKMLAIKEILAVSKYGSFENLPVNETLRIESEPYMALVIEKIAENRISVGHYYEKNFDLCRDPEVVFKIEDGEWIPVEYVQDPYRREVDENGLEIQDFLDMWSKNLRHQGFVDAAHATYC